MRLTRGRAGHRRRGLALACVFAILTLTLAQIDGLDSSSPSRGGNPLGEGIQPLKAWKSGLSALGKMMKRVLRFTTSPVRLLGNLRPKKPPLEALDDSEQSDEEVWENWEPLSEAELAQARIPPELNERLQAVGQLQNMYEQQQVGFFQAMDEIERRYQPIFQIEYDKRNNLITKGKMPKASVRKSEPIPDFWRTVLMSHPTISQLLNAKDLTILGYLRDIKVTNIDQKTRGFKIRFEFDPNPYMDDTYLEKTYRMKSTLSLGQQVVDDILSKPEKVSWKPMKDPSLVMVTRKFKNGSESREVEVGQSFFNLFSPLPFDQFGGDLTPEEMEQRILIEKEIQNDLDIGFIIKDEVIPDATKYYLAGRKALKEHMSNVSK
ncbi:hypothetical protein AAMO2058_000091100 [Amorphochlora amoebiformis]